MKKGFLFLFLANLLAIVLLTPATAAEKSFSGFDKKFFDKAASGGMMEVQLGEMVQQKAQSQEVKGFAGRMVSDHGQANDELKKIARQKNAPMPAKLDPKHQKVVDKFAKLSGQDLDKQYMREMVKDHAKDVAEFKKAAQKLKDTDLNGWAGKTLPVLEQHLMQAKEIAQKLGADAAAAEHEGKKEAKESK
jgi:putative membrane protein